MLPESGERTGLYAELELLRTERTLLCELLAAEGRTLSAFVRHAGRASARVRALLQQRAREPVAYLRKLERLRRLYVRLAARAGAVPLPTLASQYQDTVRTLAAAGASCAPSGDALLPALPLIEEGFLTLATLAARAGLPLTSRRDPRARKPSQSREQLARSASGVANSKLAAALQMLAARIATEQGKRVEFSTLGLERAPESQSGAIFDILGQLLRNAIEHGLETPAQRSEAGKSSSGALLAEYHMRGSGQSELIFQDDGQGLQAERIMQAGRERGMISDADAAALDPRQASTLIFQPGLSTAQNPAGRGHGMKIVREHVKRMNGQIQVATKRGQFTRIRIRLPAHIGEENSQAARRA
jgi:signal transduction histidine kinase